MLSIVLWKWGSAYTGEHVNSLARQIGRHYVKPHRVICCTNDASGIGPGIEIIPDGQHWADLQSPHRGGPSCYRRLYAFHPGAQWFGERMVSLDLDTVLVGDMAPLWDRDDDAVFWQDPIYPSQYCGAMWMLKAGARPKVWTEFNERSPALAKAAGFRGSDQAIMSWMLPGEKTWTRADGVLSFRIDCKGGLPKGARAVFFHGNPKPWQCAEPWIRAA